MKRKKHGREEIIGKLREAEGLEATGQTLGQVCQKLEISGQTLAGGTEIDRSTCHRDRLGGAISVRLACGKRH